MAWPSAVSAGTRKACGERQLAHGVGGERAHPLRRDVADALAEPRQAFQRALARLGGEAALAVQAFGHAHGLAQAVDHAQLAQRVARHHHVEAVGAEVDRGEQVAVLQGREMEATAKGMREY